MGTDLIAFLLAVAPIIAAVVTAVATIALWHVTRVLAVETRRMALAANAPHVVATIEPNMWTLHHFDIHVSNAGNGPAYDVSVVFDPPLPHEPPTRLKANPPPLRRISVLRPGQRLSSYLAGHQAVMDRSFAATITWRRAPGGDVETNHYVIDMSDYEAFNSLGERDPIVSIAQDMKKIREKVQNWRDH